MLVLVLAACDSGVGDGEWLARPGVVYLATATGVDSARVEVDGILKAGTGLGTLPTEYVEPGPAVVRAGEPVEVLFLTYGAGSHAHVPLPSEVTVEGMTARIAVRDSAYQGITALVRQTYRRSETVVFAEPGAGALVIAGSRNDLDGRGLYDYTFTIPVVVEE